MSLCKNEDSPGPINSPPDSDMDISSENSEPSAQIPQRGRRQAVQTRQGRGRGWRVRGRGRVRGRACAHQGSSQQQSSVGRDVVSPANAATGKVNSKATFCTVTNVTKIYRVVQCGFPCHCRPILSACWA